MSDARAIVCPACQSKVSADGRKVLERSARLRELEQLPALVPELTARLEKLEGKFGVPVKSA